MSLHCDFPLRVRYAETDQMGLAYYANYFIWFEVGRAEFCRQRGFSYEQLERETHSFLVVAEAHCRYQTPLRYDAEFLVRTRLKEFRKRMLTFAYQLLNPAGDIIYAEGETVHVVTDNDGRPKSFPELYKKFLIDD
ncbi:MAG TPA: thioesterase family protein [Acidobacteriota bacterium]|jgi:acyl-CoA thioester hydrolase|nr:thioesterase family protein [Acidobacteriota bacterium]